MSKRRMKYHSNDEISYYNFLHSMKDKIVTVYRGGPEAIEGILVDNADGHYTIVKNQEVLRIYPFHIKSISLGPKGSYKKEDQKNEQSQEDNNDKDSNSFISSKSYSSSKSSKRSLRSSDYQSSRSSGYSSSLKSSGKQKEDYSYETIVRTIDYHWKRKY
ncbi:hypothetical protein U7118_02715 [Bacillus subtilis]|nr:hypothetical protein [Bacillus subtilis]MDK7659127.1 hypothetical protein [Bacillus subtilis]MEC0321509.1 hypothetical protein [Bacillus subtilis]MEC0367881.1 hypothetical protein [Bacillus subtilis]MEC0401948.1 hypothetical protein [Bacillus subtilis]MEC0430690.1 hypothetical protein [Bacillus subtilis]